MYCTIYGKQKSEVTLYPDRLTVDGKFWYLKDKEFCRPNGKSETAYLKNFLGMGYLRKRSYKKTLLFVFGGTILEGFKLLMDKLSEWLDNANDYLQWFDMELALPDWMNYTLDALAILCLVLGLLLFFSKKKVIEISFTDKRLCIPEKELTKTEYVKLYQDIVNAKQKLNQT